MKWTKITNEKKKANKEKDNDWRWNSEQSNFNSIK